MLKPRKPKIPENWLSVLSQGNSMNVTPRGQRDSIASSVCPASR